MLRFLAECLTVVVLFATGYVFLAVAYLLEMPQ